jgi:hypothetical protein
MEVLRFCLFSEKCQGVKGRVDKSRSLPAQKIKIEKSNV